LVVALPGDTAHESVLDCFNLLYEAYAQVGFVCCIFDAFIYW